MQASPLILDLDGDGVETTALNSSRAVYWDVDNDGFREASAWVGADDGLLVRDLNSNGLIDSHSELFGTATTDGFTVLTALDSNTDNKITSADSAWSSLKVWKDANGDGVTQSGELYTLGGLNITEISLADTALTGVTNNGNAVTHRSTFVMNGISRTIDDVWFNYDNVNSVDARDYTFDTDTLLLPELRGYGAVSHLSIAMSNDATLKGLVQTVATADIATLASPAFNIEQKITDILYRWAGVDGVSPTSRGLYIDARVVEFLEELFDEDFRQGSGGLNTSPTFDAAVDLMAGFGIVHEAVLGRILFQSALRGLFSETPVFNYASDTFTGSYTLDSSAVTTLLGGAALDDQFYVWSNVFKLIDYTVGLSSLTSGEQAAINTLIDTLDSGSTLSYSFMASNFEYVYGTTFTGTSGNDTMTHAIPSGAVLNGLAGVDTITGNAGDDTINGGAGADVLNGGAGDDTFILASTTEATNDSITGGSGHDIVKVTSSGAQPINIATVTLNTVEELRVNGTGGGTDTVTLTASQAGMFTTLSHVLGGSTTIALQASAAGTYNFSGVTSLTGLLKITGTTGNDTITGTAWDDTILGGNTGTDVLSGGNGNDTIYASNTTNVSGSSTINGGEGNDTIYAGYGADTLNGDNGDDTFVMSGTMMGASDALHGDGGYDVLLAATGHNITWTANLSGLEELRISGASASLNISAYALGQFGSIVMVNGAGAALTLTASAAGTFSFAGKTVTAALTFNGSNGVDTITGSSGADIINGGWGNDTINAGAGNDTIRYAASSGNDVVDGGDGSDTITATANNTDIYLAGLSNVETITSGGFTGIDIIGTASGDTLNFSGVTLSGIGGIYGGGGADVLTGNSAANTIYGEAGADTIRGGGGNDTMSGGTDADTFVFDATGNGVDTITDFTNGSDKIDLRAMGITFANLTVTTVGTAVRIVKTGSSDIDITLNSFSAANVDSSDFLFT